MICKRQDVELFLTSIQCGIFTGISTFPKTLVLATQTQSGIIPVYTIFSRSETSRAPQALLGASAAEALAPTREAKPIRGAGKCEL